MRLVVEHEVGIVTDRACRSEQECRRVDVGTAGPGRQPSAARTCRTSRLMLAPLLRVVTAHLARYGPRRARTNDGLVTAGRR